MVIAVGIALIFFGMFLLFFLMTRLDQHLANKEIQRQREVLEEKRQKYTDHGSPMTIDWMKGDGRYSVEQRERLLAEV
jgi:hypothetical protein